MSKERPRTIYWPLSYAEFYWPKFHFLFDEIVLFNSNSKRQKIVNNSQILDCSFTDRTKSFF